MRKLVFALLLLCSALFATAQEWQWSVRLKGFISSETGKEPTAFLWIPSDCHQLRAVMVGKHNMSEETLFEMPRFVPVAQLKIIKTSNPFCCIYY